MKRNTVEVAAALGTSCNIDCNKDTRTQTHAHTQQREMTL